MERMQVQLTGQQVAALRELATRRGASMAELVRQGVTLLLRAGTLREADEQKSRALSAIGSFASGRKDGSRNHDEVLAEAYWR